MLRVGIDAGSTTVKLVAIDASGDCVFSAYERHNARAIELLVKFLNSLQERLGDVEISLEITGSVGLGISKKFGFGFVQELLAATKAVKQKYPQTKSLIDIGGEDAKIVFFGDSGGVDLRMNGNCAGGTGAFIDQMALILGTDVDSLSKLASEHERIYPIASRCGVFCKTDIQNLIAQNASRPDIAASIFHAVAVQTIVALAHGREIDAPVLFCGGPLTFIPALREAFFDYLKLGKKDVIIPEAGALLPAWGAALSASGKTVRISELIENLKRGLSQKSAVNTSLEPIFKSDSDYAIWLEKFAKYKIDKSELKAGKNDVFLGIDSGSTTTKIVLLNPDGNLLFSYYSSNGGNSIKCVERGLLKLKEECGRLGASLNILGSCSTGYGEDLVKAAFQLDCGIVETMAHYMAAKHLNPKVSFILDIGGQDMKAIFVRDGIVERVDINEACSSGCGSFIETFAKTLGYGVSDFAKLACLAKNPCDLGTRCTVFMNSKVKQALSEGAGVDDIAAGLAYSVVKNCLYKVLKLKDASVLGRHLVVQGGTMRNDAIVRALELLTSSEVARCDIPELMGALGCALYARQNFNSSKTLDEILSKADYELKLLHCGGCENKCAVSRYKFANGKIYFAGNRCEKIFTNGKSDVHSENIYDVKNELLFKRTSQSAHGPVIGIPRCLNMYEDYPFWHALFTSCGMTVVLSGPSNMAEYEKCARQVMSDNICFPAKLVHAHIENLVERKVDRIFLPYVVFEKNNGGQNSYNCPIVTAYSEVIKGVGYGEVKIDTPLISFKDRSLLYKQCERYLTGLDVEKKTIRKAFEAAEKSQMEYVRNIVKRNRDILKSAIENNRPLVLLAGRPYHSDALIQHKISNAIASMGVCVISDDIARFEEADFNDVHFLAQWAYPNNILRAAKWCAGLERNIPFVQMTSFGCGPDAFLLDEVADVLERAGKTFTLLKLDDINNIGSMKLRVRSLLESLKYANSKRNRACRDFVTSAPYEGKKSRRKLLAPFFTPFISPLLPSILESAGYELEILPMSDEISGEFGLMYANNEVCYPATLIVGDIVKAFKSGRYKPEDFAVAISQTGGQCRASNYAALIKKALVAAGYSDVPVVSLSFGDDLDSGESRLKVNWIKLLPVALRAVLYSDCIAKFYYASAVREKRKGQAAHLRDEFLGRAKTLILNHRSGELFDILKDAARQFNDICEDVSRAKVGVVGEIFLKYNPYAQRETIDWLISKNIEPVPSCLIDFFVQCFVNSKVNVGSLLERRKLSDFLLQLLYKIVKSQIEKVNAIASEFKYFRPFEDIFESAREAEKVVSLNSQFGEGWLLPAEIMSLAKSGVKNVISLQPFGCIANHIVSKGIERRVKAHYPDMNILSLDFDGGVSGVNITNRLLLFADNLK